MVWSRVDTKKSSTMEFVSFFSGAVVRVVVGQLRRILRSLPLPHSLNMQYGLVDVGSAAD